MRGQYSLPCIDWMFIAAGRLQNLPDAFRMPEPLPGPLGGGGATGGIAGGGSAIGGRGGSAIGAGGGSAIGAGGSAAIGGPACGGCSA